MPIYIGGSTGIGVTPILTNQNPVVPISVNLKHDSFEVTNTIINNGYIDLTHAPVNNTIIDGSFGNQNICKDEHYDLSGTRVTFNFPLTIADLGLEICFSYLY